MPPRLASGSAVVEANLPLHSYGSFGFKDAANFTDQILNKNAEMKHQNSDQDSNFTRYFAKGAKTLAL